MGLRFTKWEPALAFPLMVLAGCCGRDAPVWLPLDPVTLEPDVRLTLELADQVTDDRDDLTFAAEGDEGVLASIDASGTLTLLSESGFEGDTSVHLTATDACGNLAETDLDVTVGMSVGACVQHVTYVARGAGTQAVTIAGTFNDWDATATPMVAEGNGTWGVDLTLAPGDYPYKVVESDYGAGTANWACDPDADFVQCDEGYTWDPSCPLGGASCNSMLVVEDCTLPTLSATTVSIDRVANSATVTLAATGEIASATATLDGASIDAWTGSGFSYTASALSDGRHVFEFSVTGTDGRTPAPIHIPFWTDDNSWQNGLLYYVFVDRFSNGDTSLDVSEGTGVASTDYEGGDWQGVVNQLDYLQDLGVTVIWLTAPQDNASGAFGGSCNTSYSGYHGYWPSDPFATEGHFGDTDQLHELIDAAHARNMRVLTDWVGNHVYEGHPYYTQHPDWFNSQQLCGDADNWNTIPETCWFDTFLPDIRYYEAAPLAQMVDDAMVWAKEYDLDGYRVDAVKHMPHSVFHNFASRVRNELEFKDAGGDEDFYTVGETYSGDQGLISSYMSPDDLDAQFDFPLYWAIVSAFGRDEIGLSNGDGSLQSTRASSASAFAGFTMSTFLGNHDVARFTAMASGEISSLYGDSSCGDDGSLRTPDMPPGWSEPYDRLRLAWTFLLTNEGLPLVYYGDEIGLPGYNDPDNRQVMRFTDLSGDESDVLTHVQVLGQARREHPAMSQGTRTDWWEGEADVWAYARVEPTSGDEVIVLLNRGDSDRTLANGLSFAGLTSSTYTDVFTGEVFYAEGDSLSVWVPALGSRVLVGE